MLEDRVRVLVVPYIIEEGDLPEGSLKVHAQALHHGSRSRVLRITAGRDSVQIERAEAEVQPGSTGFGGKPLPPMVGAEEPSHVALTVCLTLHLDTDIPDHGGGRFQVDGHMEILPLRSQREIAGGGDELPRLILGVGTSAQKLTVPGKVVDGVVDL